MDESRSGLNSPGESPFSVSPLNRQLRSSPGVPRRTQNMQAVAAAQRLARVMAHHSGDDEDAEDDDIAIEYNTSGLGLSAGRARRPRPSVAARQPVEHPPSRSPPSVIRPSLQIRTNEQTSVRSATSVTSSSQPFNSTEQSPSSYAVPAVGRRSVSTSNAEQNLSGRSPPVVISQPEQHPRLRSMARSRPIVGIKTVHKIASSAPVSHKQQALDSMNLERNSLASESRDASALQDEVDMLQEENDNLAGKLRLTEERYEEAEARAKQLETQVSTLGEGVSFEARLLSRRKSALQKETVKEDSASAMEQLKECESELRSLQSAVQRLVLTQEEMEEVVLKRCWLARYWGLCVQYGIHPDIAEEKHEYWSSWAPLPLEVVLSVGQKAKDDHQVNSDCEREKVVRDVNQIFGEHNAESMLLVEKGLRELASLKVEDAVLLEMAQRRKQNMQKSVISDETRAAPTELHKFGDPCELSQDEAEEVQFKLAWLTYFWRRAKSHGLEGEIAEERLETWINQSSRHPNSHDAVDVERGMMELRKLGIDTILWEESRKCTENDSNSQ